MECCDVCCDKLNKTTHKKVKCPYCDLISCKSCSQRYLLTLIDDPHCMNCKKLWNREFIDSFCTIKFRNVDLKKHRENTLFERQKLLMPATQPAVERIITMRTLRTQIHDVKKQILNIQRGLGLSIHTPINPDDEIMTLPEMKILVPQLQDLQTRLSYLRNTGISPNDGEDPNRKFVRKCPSGVCKGFLDENWYCGICTTNFCDKCNLWTDKDIIHCDDCGICRVGTKLYHCKLCDACYNSEDHDCIGKILSREDKCPVCQEVIFTSLSTYRTLKCGHRIHSNCLESYLQSNFNCPICKKSIFDMTQTWEICRQHKNDFQIPEDLEDIKVNI